MSEALAAIDEALLGLRRLWAQSGAFEDPALGPVELSTVLVCHEVAARAAVREEATVSAVAHGLLVAHSTASRLVDRAVEAGVVDRVASPADARRTALRLTPAGRRLHRRATRFRTAYLAELTADWPEHRRADFAALLTDFADAVRGRPTPGAGP